MKDLHSHIIPGIDDGAKNMHESLLMAEQAVSNGVTHMVCTPHIHPSFFDNNRVNIEQGFIALADNVKQEGIPLSLSFAAEVRVNDLIPIWLKNNELPFIGTYEGRDVLLLEMPHSHVPSSLDMLVKWLINNNVQPLVAHPERNRDILKQPSLLQWLARLGCLFQVTAGAFTGRFGEHVQALSKQMLVDQAFHIVASDTHDTHRRPNEMKKAYDVVASYDEAFAQRAFLTLPSTILSKLSD